MTLPPGAPAATTVSYPHLDVYKRQILIHLEQAFLDGNMHLVLYLRAQLLGHQAGGVEIDDLGDSCHDAQAISFLMTCATFTFRRLASSPTVISSGMDTFSLSLIHI